VKKEGRRNSTQESPGGAATSSQSLSDDYRALLCHEDGNGDGFW
jgi:hypothetical protein